jgi:hypothetical protein
MIAVYDRSDLIQHANDKTIRQVTLADFRFANQPIQLAAAVIFIDVEKGLMRVMKWRWKADFDINAIFSSNEFMEVMKDALKMEKSLGTSLLKPGTDNLKE